MNDETMREAFEKWMRTCEGHPFAGQFANLMWKAWQACWNTRAQASTSDEWQGEVECCDAKGFWLILSDNCHFVPGQKVTIKAPLASSGIPPTKTYTVHFGMNGADTRSNAKAGEVVVTRDESGEIVAVTRQDEEGQILSVIATRLSNQHKATKRGIADAVSQAKAGEVESVYVECRQCDVCDHIGINDASTTEGACHNCDWQGSEPIEDKCPGCGDTDCMAAACPECGGRYALIADTRIALSTHDKTKA